MLIRLRCAYKPFINLKISSALTIHIAFNIDHAYVRFLCVTLVSILHNNANSHIVAHILSRGLTTTDCEIIQQLVSKYNGEVCFYSPNEKLLEGFRIHASSGHISLVTYYRCMLADYLPSSLERIIYMDSDLLVIGSLADFWNTPLLDKPVAAILDAAADDHARYKTLCHSENEGYFNAGVLLINLDWWRKNNVRRLCIDYYHKYPERIRFNDQDLLNSIFHGKVQWISMKYNAQEGFYRTRYAHYDEHKTDLERPVVVHFTNRKPWDWDCTHPLQQLFYYYQKFTPWRNQNILHNPVWFVARLLKLLPYAIRLRRPRYRHIELKN